MIIITRLVTALLVTCLASLTAMASIDAELLSGMKARSIGPAATSGRITDIESLVNDPNIIYAGTATGGLWRSENAGLTWQPLFDKEDFASIGAIAIDQNNPDIIWVGTGEGNTRNSTSIGGGIYRSIDGGKSFTKMGLSGTERINRIALHPSNSNIIYVAALGTLWSSNSERGVYKTVDGGKSWEKVLYTNQKTGASDIKMDPLNPSKLYASMWEFQRKPYHFKSGGPGSGLYLSYDGGETWQRKTEDDGLPKGELGRITISVSKSHHKIVYALVEAEKSALVRSDDGGISWKKVNETTNIADRPFYYSEIEVDPTDPNTVYNIATLLTRSIDGGKTFAPIQAVACCDAGNTIHIDSHTLWINPVDPTHLILGNDGGIAISRDKGDSWRFVENLPLSQFYHIRVDNDHPYNIYGGTQDNGSWRGPGEVWHSGGIRNVHWQEISFGDGFDAMPFPDDTQQGYSQSQGGFLYHWSLKTGETRLLRPGPAKDGTRLRFNWSSGLAQDPFDSSTIYYGSQFVHRSKDRGLTWEIISDDLSTNNKKWQIFNESGGITPDVTSAENYTSIVSIAPSPIKQGVIWVGTDDGRLYVTQDGGKTWTSIERKIKGPRKNAWIPHIEPSQHDPDSAYFVVDDHRRGDMKTYAFQIRNYGRQITRLDTEGVRGYALSILQDHVDPELLFLGTELGLHVSTDGGESWFKWTEGVPTVSVMDMAIQHRENDLVLGTHGRSIYIIDDYSALRGLKQSSFNTPLKVLSVTDGQQYQEGRAASTRFWGSSAFAGENEAYGVVLTVMSSGDFLAHPNKEKNKARLAKQRKVDAQKKDKPEQKKKESDKKPTDKAKVEVFNQKGDRIRTFKVRLQQGINRIVWDFEVDGMRRLPEDKPREDADILPGAHEVPPGQYTIKVTLNDASVEAKAKVLADPRYDITAGQFSTRYEQNNHLLNLMNAWSDAIHHLTDSKSDVAYIKGMANKQLAKVKNKKEHPLQMLVDSAKDIEKRIDELHKTLRVLPDTKGITSDHDKLISHIGLAQFYLGSNYGAPSPTALLYINEASKATERLLKPINDFLGNELANFKKAYLKSGLSLLNTPAISVKK